MHEAIPLTGTIVNYATGAYGDANIKNYAHGMFQSVYDYPYLSSSANHIFDLTIGYPEAGGLAATSNTMNAKKKNIYNEMAQVLAGFDESGNVRQFDRDGDLTGGEKFHDALFINFTRLLAKDEIKKGSFSLELGVGLQYDVTQGTFDERILITDPSGSTGFKVNSPAGEYGLLYATDGAGTPLVDGHGSQPCGLLYYQAGICVLTGGVFLGTSDGGWLDTTCMFGDPNEIGSGMRNIQSVLTGSTISASCNYFRHRVYNLSFNNTTELNSTIYFCRANHGDFNYSSNPTYLSSSKMVVKNNSTDSPVSYTTGVGLYSADNELLAVAKLSEPLKKDPNSELTLRVRLDY